MEVGQRRGERISCLHSVLAASPTHVVLSEVTRDPKSSDKVKPHFGYNFKWDVFAHCLLNCLSTPSLVFLHPLVES